jgi:formiminotetrahydrofolate cyclodeaminase
MHTKDLTCETFVDALSSKEPVPGGGGAAALALPSV